MLKTDKTAIAAAKSQKANLQVQPQCTKAYESPRFLRE